MLEGDEVSSLLDILGNRNRRRIIQLLRQKPCFVTEISDRLVISPKAVIEHLQMMERENILTSRGDEINRRKYYRLSRDFRIMVQIEDVVVAGCNPEKENENFKLHLLNRTETIRKMIKSRDDILVDLDYLERDLDKKIHDLKVFCKEIIDSEAEVNLVLALAGYNMGVEDLEEFSGISGDDMMVLLDNLIEKGIVEKSGGLYKLCGNYDT